MRTVLLLIGLIVSSVSFAGEKQLTCLFIQDDITGLLDKGAWKSNKIIFNTDDFDELDPLLTLIVEMKFRIPEEDYSQDVTDYYDDLRYRVSPSSLIFERDDMKYQINRTNLTISAGNTDGECSIRDVEVLRNRVF